MKLAAATPSVESTRSAAAPPALRCARPRRRRIPRERRRASPRCWRRHSKRLRKQKRDRQCVTGLLCNRQPGYNCSEDRRRQKTQLQSPSLAMRSSSVGVEEAAYPMTSMREEEEAERKGCGSWALISFFLFCKASSPLVPVDRPVSRLCGRLIDCRAQSSRPHRQSTVDRAHKVQGLAR